MFSWKSSQYTSTADDDTESESTELPQYTRRRDSIRALIWTWIFLLSGLLLLLLAYLVASRLQHDHNGSSEGLQSPYSFFPNFPLVYTRFEEPSSLMRFDEEGDRAWDEMIPEGAGYLRVPYPRRFDMEESVPFGQWGNDPEDSEVYQASVVHQLHCLGALRYVLKAYKNGERLNNKYDSEWHMAHCLNNLRQGILCAADPTLLWSTGTLDDDGYYKAKFTGTGTVHKCQNWEALKEVLVERRSKDWNKTIGET